MSLEQVPSAASAAVDKKVDSVGVKVDLVDGDAMGMTIMYDQGWREDGPYQSWATITVG